jgi:RimJ/RimL family protein N-acetyltransferase
LGLVFSPKKELTEAELAQLTNVDFSRVVALLVTKQAGEDEVLIGGGRYASDGPNSDQAEIAFMTSSDFRGLGIASLILTHLQRIAREAGVQRFEADVLAENQPMLAVFRRSDLPMSVRREGNVMHVTLSLSGPNTSLRKNVHSFTSKIHLRHILRHNELSLSAGGHIFGRDARRGFD